MQLRLYAYLSAIILTIFGFVSTGKTQPSKIPPVAVGPQTLPDSVGFYEFFTQPNSSNGDITGIAAPDTFYLYVTGIDASGVTGLPGRKIVFNLQDSEAGSSFKNLGISFVLQKLGTGTDFLECYQADGFDGSSTHDLGTGVLSTNILDLRFGFTKTSSTENWTIAPNFRLNSGAWTPFFDGSFTATESFDFLGAKLTVGFLDQTDGQVSFDNFFVTGPINPPITETFVDDDWAGLTLGDAVQFPGQFNVQVFGVNAFATIQGGIDSLVAQGALGTVNVAAGMYVESVQIDSLVHVIGSGSGDDPLEDTIVQSPIFGISTITINGLTASGTSPTERFILSDMRVTDASGLSYTSGSGILVQSVIDTTSFMTFDNIVAVNNGCGIAFAEGDPDPDFALKQNSNATHQSAFFNDIEILNSTFSDNNDTGILLSPILNSFDSLTVSNCDISDNGRYGLTTSGVFNVTNVHIDSTTFSGNGTGGVSSAQQTVSTKGNESQVKFSGTSTVLPGDIHMINFNGDASFTDVTITGNDEAYGIELRGDDDEGTSPSGTVTFTNFQVDGSFDEQDTEYGGGMLIADYSDIANMTFTNVDLDVTPTAGADSVANVFFCHIDGTFNVNDTDFGGNASILEILFIESTGGASSAQQTVSTKGNESQVKFSVLA